MQLQPDLSEAWEVSPDHREFTLTLRPGLTFHSGRRLDAGAAAACFQRISEPRLSTPLKADLCGLSRVEATGPLTLRFVFAEPNAVLLAALSLRCYVVDDSHAQPVGAGTYEVTEWVTGSHVRLRRFAGHYAAIRFAAEEVVIRRAPYAAQRVAALEAGAADIIETVPQTLAVDLAARVGRPAGGQLAAQKR